VGSGVATTAPAAFLPFALRMREEKSIAVLIHAWRKDKYRAKTMPKKVFLSRQTALAVVISELSSRS
jgi:hypothetical protein